jgi:hypothetical protein
LNPANTEYKAGLAITLTNISWLQRTSGALRPARDSLEKALEIQEAISNPQPAVLYSTACMFAGLSELCASERESRSAGDRAMASLRQAVAAGYRDIAELTKDSKLDPLRKRPDFRSLIMDLDFPTDPIAR